MIIKRAFILFITITLLCSCFPNQIIFAEPAYDFNLSILENTLEYGNHMIEGSVDISISNNNMQMTALLVCTIIDQNDATIATETKPIAFQDSTDILNETISFSTPALTAIGNKVKVLLWNNAEQMKPLALPAVSEITAGEITLKIESLLNAQDNGNNYSVSYVDELSIVRTIRVEPQLDIYYNGNRNYASSFSEFNYYLINIGSKYGTIDFIKSQTDNDYFNILHIKAYENFIVGYADEVVYRIYADDSSPSLMTYISFDPNDYDVLTTIVDQDGNSVAPTELKQYDVLCIQSNKLDISVSKEVYKCILIRKSVSGMVVEKTFDNPPKYAIDGQMYKIDPLSESMLNFELGFSGTFYLDMNDRIVAAHIDNIEPNYALYIMGVPYDFSGYRVKLYTAEGNMMVADLASKVRWMVESGNGNYSLITINDEHAFSLLADKSGEICKYRTNNYGQISSLIFSTESTKAEAGGTIAYNNIAYRADALTTNANAVEYATILAKNLEYKRIRVGGKTFDLDQNAKIIAVNQNGMNWYQIPESKFETWNLDSIIDDQAFSHNVKVSVYDVNADNMAKLIFINGDALIMNYSTGVSLLKSKSLVYNANGDEVIKFRIISNTNDPVVESSTNTKEFVLSGDCNADGLYVPIGSIVRSVSRNSLNEVTRLEVLTELTQDGFKPTYELIDKIYQGGDIEYYFGTITNKQSSTIIFHNQLTGLEESRVISPSTKVMIYDERRVGSGRVYEGSIAEVQYNMQGNISAKDVTSYDIFISTYQGKIEDVVLYINK